MLQNVTKWKEDFTKWLGRCSILNLLTTVGSPKKSDVVTYITCLNKQTLSGIYVSIASLGSEFTGKVKVYIWLMGASALPKMFI
jgi:hypothetical protein